MISTSKHSLISLFLRHKTVIEDMDKNSLEREKQMSQQLDDLRMTVHRKEVI